MTIGEFEMKYHHRLMSPDKQVASNASYCLMGALLVEACNEINMLHTSNIALAVAVLKRKDAVWRMLATWHPNVILEDAFKNFWLEQWPDLHEHWR